MTDEDIALKPWEEAENFDDLLELNLKFLYHKLHAPYYYDFTLQASTYDLVPGLVGLVRNLRIFILVGRRSDYVNGESDETLGYFDYWGRPYICFMMADKDKPSKLFEKLKENADVKVYGRRVNPFSVVPGSEQEEIIVSQDRKAWSLEELKKQAWQPYHAIRLYDPSDQPFFQLNTVRQADPWLIELVGAEWGKDIDLISMIKTAAEECGMGGGM